jgi:salicylate hydroxylase
MATASDSPKREYNLAIIGGGISGLTLAITLLRYNIPITIYEAAAHFAEIGAGVYLGPNAGRAMKLMSPKIHDAFLKTRTVNQWKEKEDSWFTIRVGDERKADKDGFVRPGKKVGDALFDVPIEAEGERGGVYRAAFLDELVKDVPEHVAQFGKRLVDLARATWCCILQTGRRRSTPLLWGAMASSRRLARGCWVKTTRRPPQNTQVNTPIVG